MRKYEVNWAIEGHKIIRIPGATTSYVIGYSCLHKAKEKTHTSTTLEQKRLGKILVREFGIAILNFALRETRGIG